MNIVSANSIKTVGAFGAVRAVAGRSLPLPLHTHLLPYPGSGLAGHAPIETVI